MEMMIWNMLLSAVVALMGFLLKGKFDEIARLGILHNAATGSNLKAPQPKGGPRKDSFCARMSGMPGPMKDEKGQPTRKAAALKRWKC